MRSGLSCNPTLDSMKERNVFEVNICSYKIQKSGIPNGIYDFTLVQTTRYKCKVDTTPKCLIIRLSEELRLSVVS